MGAAFAAGRPDNSRHAIPKLATALASNATVTSLDLGGTAIRAGAAAAGHPDALVVPIPAVAGSVASSAAMLDLV